MKARSKKFLSLLLATAMVFTLNTTVFAEEVAVDSVEETVDASVDAVDEVAEEATVDEATTDAGADASTTYTSHHLKYTKDGNNDPVLNSTVVYETDPNVKKNAKYNVVKMTNVDDCVSWANVYKNVTTDDNGDTVGTLSYTNPKEADEKNNGGDMGPNLIYTVLKGSKDDTANLVNNKEQNVSSNGADTGDATKVGNQVRDSRFATYKVIKLDENGHYLFVGYGDTNAEQLEADGAKHKICEQGQIQGITDSFVPVFDYDGRQIAFSKDGKHKMTGSKNERLDVAAALVKYDKTTGTLQEIPGVEVSGVKLEKKTGKNATVSGQATLEGWSYEAWDDTLKKVETKSKDTNDKPLTHSAYKKEAELGTFTINLKVSGKNIDKDVKKAIKDKIKEEKFSYAISKYVVDTEITGAANTYLFRQKATPDATSYTSDFTKISENMVAEHSKEFFDDTENKEDYKLDGGYFTISKFNEEKGKADLTFNVKTFNGTTNGDATVKLKAGTDYKFVEGTVGGKKVQALDFTGNFEYNQGNNKNDITNNGYKYAFRQTPATDDNKKPKTFRRGIFKASGDGFVYSVDETAEEVDAVEEAF